MGWKANHCRAVFRHSLYENADKDGLQTVVEQNLVLLPETLDVSANAVVESRKRGIYDASVYGSDIVLKGTFDMQALEKSGVSLSQIKWDEIRLI